MKNFSKKEAIKFGFETTKKNWKFIIPVMLIMAAVNYLPSYLNSVIAQDNNFLGFIVSLVEWVITSIITIGMIKISLKFVDNQKGEFADLYKHYRLVLKFIAGSILYGLIGFVGLLLFIIPGIIWMIKFQFFSYFIVDKNMSPIDALKKSWEITKGVKLNLFLFGLILAGVTILGFLALVVGLLVAIPTTMLATAYVYRKLSSGESISPAVSNPS